MALIILPFAFWGIESYTRSGDAGVVATVNGEKISQQEFEGALRQQQERLREQLGAGFDPAIFDTPEMKRAVLDNLVGQRLILDRAKDVGLVVTDEQIAQIVGGIEAFHVDGQFDKKRYQEVLKRENMSPKVFESRLTNELLVQQMQDSYLQNGFASASVADNIIRLNEQERVVRVSLVSKKQFQAKAETEVSDEMANEYFQKNPSEFQIPEQAKVEFVKLSIDGLVAQVSVDKGEIRDYYDTHQNEYVEPEIRKAAHILITADASLPQAEQDAARAKAEQLLLQIKRNPAEFAALAKKHSQDPGSAEKGGDLGFFGRGAMVKPFDDAVFSMKTGQISGVVKSEFGYHIIKLIEIQPPKGVSFDEAREGIAYQLRQQKAADKFAELAEQFNNVVYEQSDTLKPAAELAGTKIEQAGWLSRNMVPNSQWTPEMLQAIFSDDVAKAKRNTTAMEVAPNTLVAARVLEYKPSALRDFTEVRGLIRERLVRQKAVELARGYGESVLGQLQAGNNPKLTWGAAQSVTRAQQASLDAALLRPIFQADAAVLPKYVGAATAQGDYVIARIDKVKEGGAVDEAKRARYTQQLRRLSGEELSRAFLADARQQADITLKLPAPAAEGQP